MGDKMGDETDLPVGGDKTGGVPDDGRSRDERTAAELKKMVEIDEGARKAREEKVFGRGTQDLYSTYLVVASPADDKGKGKKPQEGAFVHPLLTGCTRRRPVYVPSVFRQLLLLQQTRVFPGGALAN